MSSNANNYTGIFQQIATSSLVKIARCQAQDLYSIRFLLEQGFELFCVLPANNTIGCQIIFQHRNGHDTIRLQMLNICQQFNEILNISGNLSEDQKKDYLQMKELQNISLA